MLWIHTIFQQCVLKYLFMNVSFDPWSSYIKNIEKAREYAWYLLYHSLTYIYTYLTYYTIRNQRIYNPQHLHPYVVSLFQYEKGIYLYDLFHTILNKDWMYVFHHIMTLLLIIESERLHLENLGVYILYLMNSTSIFLYTARLLRHLHTTSYIVYADTCFLSAFGYYRIWKYSIVIYNEFNNPLTSIIIRILGILMYILQWIWFVYLSKLYINNYLKKNKPSVFSSISIQFGIWKSLIWKIQRPFRKIIAVKYL